MFDIGASLAAAREARGYSLADAERLTNVRQKYLTALERGDFDALPGRTYARAFLRTYSSALGLEADKLVAAFEELVPEPEDEQIAVVTPRRRPRIRLSYVAGVVAIGGVVAVAAWGATTRTSKTLPPPTRAAIVPVVATPATQPAAQAKKVVLHSVAPAVHPSALLIRATRGDCWLLVRRGGASGTVVYQGMLRLGTSVRFAGPGLWVRFGAPWNVEATRGAKPVVGLDGTQPVDVTA